MTISQDKVGKLLERSTRPEETEEVLLAYCFSKWMNGGNQAQVLRKLHLLTLFLRAVDLGYVLRNHYQAFAIVASLTKSNAGPVVLLPTTELGLEAWNAARRPSKSVLKRVFEGGKGYTRSGGLVASSNESSDAEYDQVDRGEASDLDAATITPATTGRNRNRSASGGLTSLMSGRRSRSNTVATLVDSGARGEETRRVAGAGAADGLGRGLLSAPPNYDGNLTSYLSASSSHSSLSVSHPVPIVTREEEHEALPDYA
ncbi:uncharacterized protein JCM15063_001178 [Sporobolomyces koalae]|uniref:uncharacterized protein n=1 Tax=Sporobolomyces koalae TaxID=500713 RepID=UPI003181EAB0